MAHQTESKRLVPIVVVFVAHPKEVRSSIRFAPYRKACVRFGVVLWWAAFLVDVVGERVLAAGEVVMPESNHHSGEAVIDVLQVALDVLGRRAARAPFPGRAHFPLLGGAMGIRPRSRRTAISSTCGLIPSLSAQRKAAR